MKEKSINYPDYDKINSGSYLCYLNDPNPNTLDLLRAWCEKNGIETESDRQYPKSIVLKKSELDFKQFDNILELFSL